VVAFLWRMAFWQLALMVLAQEMVSSSPNVAPASNATPTSSEVLPSDNEPEYFHVLGDASLGLGDSVDLLGGEDETGPVITAGLTGALERGPFRYGARLRFLSADLTTHTQYYHASDKMYAGSVCGFVQRNGLWGELGFGARWSRHKSNGDEGSSSGTVPNAVFGFGYDLYLVPSVALRGTAEVSTAILEWMAFVSVGLVVRI